MLGRKGIQRLQICALDIDFQEERRAILRKERVSGHATGEDFFPLPPRSPFGLERRPAVIHQVPIKREYAGLPQNSRIDDGYAALPDLFGESLLGAFRQDRTSLDTDHSIAPAEIIRSVISVVETYIKDKALIQSGWGHSAFICIAGGGNSSYRALLT